MTNETPRYPVISSDPDVQEFYLQRRKAGESHNMAEMLALRCGPRVHGTDSGFMRGTNGKKWISQLGNKNDPRAWVSSADDLRTEVKRRGWSCEGMVNVKGAKQDIPDPQPYRVADDLVEKEVARRVEEDPGLAQRTKPDVLRESVREAISPANVGMTA